jgi:hypothetical protein
VLAFSDNWSVLFVLTIGEGDEARFKEILDEASATVLYDRILMLLFAIGYGKRAERSQRTNFGHRG